MKDKYHTIVATEKKIEIYNHYNDACFVCGKPMEFTKCQLAHILGNTLTNRRLYGKRIIDNFLNVLPVCSLACNALVDLGNNEMLKEKVASIIDSLMDTADKRDGIEGLVIENIARKQGKVD